MKNIKVILVAVALASVMAAFTSCGGDDNTGMTDGTVTMNSTGRVSDVIGTSAESSR